MHLFFCINFVYYTKQGRATEIGILYSRYIIRTSEGWYIIQIGGMVYIIQKQQKERFVYYTRQNQQKKIGILYINGRLVYYTAENSHRKSVYYTENQKPV
jgi:hypothetical protein